jgi:hypothetical protein
MNMTDVIFRIFPGALLTIVLFSFSYGENPSPLPPPSWQNPDFGFTLDGVIDADDANGSWKSAGLNLRGAELIVSANIDPYASLTGNILFTENGAELHEAFADFPFLPGNLKCKLGLMLAHFGHWNRFHLHSMPFTSEPGIYRHYSGGMLALKGIELSWMVPMDHFIEISFSVYDRIQGHSHDTDPLSPAFQNARTTEEIADAIGASKHGSHWHGADGTILYEEDLLRLSDETTSSEPVLITNERRPKGFAYGTRISSSFELGQSFSLDIGASGLYQNQYKRSQIPELNNRTYSKLLYGADLVLFWHPLTSNSYRNMQIGTEMLGSFEGFERKDAGKLYEDYYSRLGLFSWVSARLSRKWRSGGFYEFFQSNDYANAIRQHYGVFFTFDITHYQYLRLGFSRYNYPELLENVNRIQLQYNATIGYHSHGRQR